MTTKGVADRKRDLAEMSEHTPDQKARDWFRRPAGVQVMIRAQTEQIRRVTAEEYLKGKMRSEADG